MRKRPYKRTDLVCLCCGNVITINRLLCHQRNVGHIKDMYCPFCDMDVKFFEVRDVSIFILECLHKENLTKEEQLVINLLEEREKNNEQSKFGLYKKVFTRK